MTELLGLNGCLCVLCQHDMTPASVPAWAPGCQHAFCLGCLTEHLFHARRDQKAEVCPICRAYFSPLEREQVAAYVRWKDEGTSKLLEKAPANVRAAWGRRGRACQPGAAPPPDGCPREALAPPPGSPPPAGSRTSG